MRKIIWFFLIAFYFCFFSSFSLAQKLPVKPGSISRGELDQTVCEMDSNARGMIICDYGRSYIEYLDHKGFVLKFDRLIRIKIFTKEGYDLADHSILLWKSGSVEETVTNLKGYTYNLENGSVTKERLKNESVFREEKSKSWNAVNFTFPKVREGSVIELEYTISSDFFMNLHDWYFQHSIPVKWSEYRTEIPEYFNYKKTMKGYESLSVIESSSSRKSIMFTEFSRPGDANYKRAISNINQYKVEYHEVRERWVAENVPPFIVEEPLSSKENFISKLEFELVSYKFPNQAVRLFTNTWDDINRLLMEDSDFGGQLKGGGFLKTTVDEINQKAKDDTDKIRLAYSFIQSHMKWNDENALYTRNNLRSAYNSASGNCAEINLMLVLLLQNLKIQASPVILSTRANGIIMPVHPTLKGFNYVIASATINDKQYLLDATDSNLPFGVLPVRALNDKGRLISKDKTDWISLDPEEISKTFVMYNLSLQEDLELTGDLQSSGTGYAGIDLRKKILSYSNQVDYIKSLEESKKGLTIEEFEPICLNNLEDPVKQKFKVKISDRIEGSGSLFYLNPLLFESFHDNPFKLEERKYPIEYPYLSEVVFMLNLTVPEGYQFEEIPENAAASTHDNSLLFQYSAKGFGNTLQILSKIQINQKTFLPQEYMYLKEFYNLIIAKHFEKIVISKT